ncbi:PIG-L family deacetylase [Sporosarcina sp. FSL K6-2383]|uniref:PIG-L deacetylase family protein n=1 Tax=Sporosarcina sp. FSL K6-2383 TaxID=2921556 RepID=UPI00315B2F54
MKKSIVIVTPHPDDETLGCGGTILRHRSAGDDVYWLIVTKMNEKSYSKERVQKRKSEIEEVANKYGFTKIFQLPYEAAKLDEVPASELVSEIGNVFADIEPNIVYAPYRNDIHSDHKVVFDATMSCTKWFRYPSIEKVLVYETLSETDFIMNTDANGFRPTTFINISSFLDEKLEIMKIYESEIAPHPFPRSEEAIRALATLRGAAAGARAAEAFMLVKERVL